MCNLGDTPGRSKVVPCKATGVFAADGIVSSEWHGGWSDHQAVATVD